MVSQHRVAVGGILGVSVPLTARVGAWPRRATPGPSH